jgi:protein subunit release factor A
MPDTKTSFSVSMSDCRVEAIASRGGNGGQNKNRRHTAIRITHPPSGAVGFSGDQNNQARNKALAWRRLGESAAFQAWARLEAARLRSGKSIEQLVDESMAEENLRIERHDEEGRWTEWE